MRLSERLDHMLRQYNYRRKRGYGGNTSNDLKMEEFLVEVNDYIDEVIEKIDKILSKGKR